MLAAINDGCSLSTLQWLADGDLSVLLTLAGFCLGVLAWLGIEAGAAVPLLTPFASPWHAPQGWALIALAALLVWCLLEAIALIRAAPANASWRRLPNAPRYAPPAAAAVPGLAGGVLCTAEGAWSYTNFLRGGLGALCGQAPNPGSIACDLGPCTVGRHGAVGATARRPWAATSTRRRLAPTP